MKNLLSFSLNDAANRIVWYKDGKKMQQRADTDFWRMMCDDGYHMDMYIKSSMQVGTVSKQDNVTTVVYDSLVDTAGQKVNARLTLTITEKADKITFASEIDNHDEKTRCNELQYPYLEFEKIEGEQDKDVLYRPRGFGERIENPWKEIAKSHTEYMVSDYYDIKECIVYPKKASMAWFGVQSEDKFLYIARKDDRARACALVSSVAPRGTEKNYLASTIGLYPFVRPGECLTPAPVDASLFIGDWRDGADDYNAFIRSTYCEAVTPPDWVKNMVGWQRIILRHQYGEIYWKFEDLPRLYLEGKEIGLDTLLVFGWWKGRFDNGYPHYEVDEELGGAEGLKAAIAEVQRLGGRVILYNNGILIDKNTDFYRKYGTKATRMDIDGNEYLRKYQFANNGTYLREYGYKTFAEACLGTKIWSDTMMENGRYKLSFNPDSIFYDQVGGWSYLCFNPEHEHGSRPDDEMYYRLQHVKEWRGMCEGDKAIGTECINDCIAGQFDYIHSADFGGRYRLMPNAGTKTIFSKMFRYVMPEIIASSRSLHDERPHWKEDLNYSFVTGHRFDVSIHRCRRDSILNSYPNYAAYLKELIALKEKHHDFFYGGKFVVDHILDTPECVMYNEYTAGGKRMFALWNNSDTEITFTVLDKTVTMQPQSVDCIVFEG